MKKLIVVILMISILIFTVSCSKEAEEEKRGIVLPDGTVLPHPDDVVLPLTHPVPPPPIIEDAPMDDIPGPAADTAEASPAGQVEEVTVQIKDFKFVPADLVVEKGTKVTWINLDSAAHTATSDEEYFDSGRLGNNEEFSFTFEEVGSWSYFCTFHPHMKANVAVE
jgi:plastocyanin